MSYRSIPHDPNTVTQATKDLTDATLQTLVLAPGQGKRLLIPWLMIYTIGGVATGLKLYSGSDLIAVCPTGTVGATPPLPTPLVLGENKAFKIQLVDSLSASVSCGVVIAPIAGSGV